MSKHYLVIITKIISKLIGKNIWQENIFDKLMKEEIGKIKGSQTARGQEPGETHRKEVQDLYLLGEPYGKCSYLTYYNSLVTYQM